MTVVQAPKRSWTTTVGEVCDTFGGAVQTGPFGSQLHASDYSKEGTPVVMPQDMVDGRIVAGRIARVSARHVTRLSRHKLVRGDIVFSRRGDVGRFAVVSENEQGWLCGTGSIRIRFNTPELNIGYVRRYFQQDRIRSWLEHHAKGVTMPNLNTDIVRKLPFVYPPLPEQHRIAAILDKADELRAKRRAALEQLNGLTQAMFLETCGDPATNPKHWAKEELQALCGSPDDIKCGPFGTQLSKSEFTDYGVPLWGIKHVNARFALATEEFIAPKTAKRLSQYSIEAGDIVMTRKGTVGNCAVYPENLPPGVMHSDLLRLRVRTDRCAPAFLAHQLQHSRDVERQMGIISGGAVMPGINVGKLKGIRVVVPPIEMQHSFARLVTANESLSTRHCSSLATMDELFSSLQHRAFAGEL